jgi:hypothetical protein
VIGGAASGLLREGAEVGQILIGSVLLSANGPRSRGSVQSALRQIAGVNPVSPADRGNIEKAAEAWLRWGKEQGYEW